MKNVITAVIVVVLSNSVFTRPAASQSGQAPQDQPSPITVRGCLRSQRGNYILIENRTGVVYALQGVGTKLNKYLRKEVEVTGEPRPGSRRTGVQPEKSGSNPSDTVHGVDGLPLQIANVKTDIRVVSASCKAADAH